MQLVALIVIGLVVFALSAPTEQPRRAPVGPPPPPPPVTTLEGTLAGLRESTSYRAEVADGVDDHEWDWWRDNAVVWKQAIDNGYHGDGIHTIKAGLDDDGAQARFYRQMWLPASRVKLSELSRQDFETAFGLLAFSEDSIHWKNSRRRESENYVYNDTSVQELGFAYLLVERVIDIVPFGSILTGILDAIMAGVGASVGQIEAAAAAEKGSLAAAVARLPVAGQQYLRARLCYCPSPKYQRRGDPTVNDPYLEPAPQSHTLAYSVKGTPEANAIYFGDPTSPWFGPNGEKFFPRAPLFEPLLFHPASDLVGGGGRGYDVIGNAEGPYLRWSCGALEGQELTDETLDGLSHRTVRRAYVYRALDVLACLMFPDEGSAWDTSGRQVFYQVDGTYTYRSPVFGPVFGSIFPPTDEDTRIIGHSQSLKVALGQTEVITHIAEFVGVQPPVTDAIAAAVPGPTEWSGLPAFLGSRKI